MKDKTVMIIVGIGGVGFLLLLVFLQMSLEETLGPLLSLRESILEEQKVREVEVNWVIPENQDESGKSNPSGSDEKKKKWIRIKVWPGSEASSCRSLTRDILSFSKRRYEGDRTNVIGFRVMCVQSSEKEENENVEYREERRVGPPVPDGKQQNETKNNSTQK